MENQKKAPFDSPKIADWQNRVCSMCGESVNGSPYTCANHDEHAFCEPCVGKLNQSDTGLNCPYDGSALVS